MWKWHLLHTQWLAVNKADDVDGINGKHYFWEKQGHMSDLLMKLKGCGMNCLEAREQDAQRVSGGVSALRRVQDRGGRASVADLEAREGVGHAQRHLRPPRDAVCEAV